MCRSGPICASPAWSITPPYCFTHLGAADDSVFLYPLHPLARPPTLELRGENHRPRHRARLGQLLDQEANHLAAHLLDRLSNAGRGGSVVSADGESSNPTTATSTGICRPAAQDLDGPGGHQVGRGEDRIEIGRAARIRRAASAPPCWVKSPSEHELRVPGNPGGLERVVIAGQPVLTGRHVLRSGDGGDPPPAARDQVLDGGPGALNVVNVDVADLRAARRPPADDDGHAPTRHGLGQRIVAVEADEERPSTCPAVR